MIENDSRTARAGISLGDRVDFRWNGGWYRGIVARLTSTKAVISTGEAVACVEVAWADDDGPGFQGGRR